MKFPLTLLKPRKGKKVPRKVIQGQLQAYSLIRMNLTLMNKNVSFHVQGEASLHLKSSFNKEFLVTVTGLLSQKMQFLQVPREVISSNIT